MRVVSQLRPQLSHCQRSPYANSRFTPHSQVSVIGGPFRIAPGRSQSRGTRRRGCLGVLPLRRSLRPIRRVYVSALGSESRDRQRPRRPRQPGVPPAGAPDAGDVVRGPHPARLLRHRVPRDGGLPRRALAAHRRPALQGARQALVQGDADPVRDRRRHRHDPVVRDGPALAGLHGQLRGRVRARVRDRGLLFLHGGDLHRDLRVRLGPPLAAHAHRRRRADDRRRVHGLADGDLGERLDEPADRVLDPRRRGRGRQAAEGAVQLEPLARADPHVPGRFPGGGVPGRVGVRRRLAARAARPPPSGRAGGGAQRRGAGGGSAAAGRRLGRAHGRGAPAGQAGRLRGAEGDQEGGAVRSVRRADRDPQGAVAARLPRPQREGEGTGHRPEGRPAALAHRQVHIPDDGLHRERACRAGCLVHVVLVAAQAAPRDRLVLPGAGGRRPAGGGRADLRMDHDRGGPPALDRLRGDEDRGRGDGGRRHPGRLRGADARLRRAGRDRVRDAAPPGAHELRGGALMLADLSAILTLVGLTAYVILGGADFGAGFWDLTAGGPERGAPVRAMIKRAMSPGWEANHVWLIFVLVMLWTGFPDAFGSITSTLAVPLFLAALGIVLRGGAFALKGQAATIAEARALGATFALSSVVVPFFLGSAAGAIAAGEGPVGNAAGDEWSSWTGPTSIMVGLLAVATGAHLAAVFLGADARRAGESELVDAFRRRALGSGVVAGALALVGLLVLRSDVRSLFDDLTSGAGLVCVLLSGAAGLVTLWLEWH